eukprot:scaffold2448_cov250-Pinguiococcus_pyrenoidosus.AAC.5
MAAHMGSADRTSGGSRDRQRHPKTEILGGYRRLPLRSESGSIGGFVCAAEVNGRLRSESGTMQSLRRFRPCRKALRALRRRYLASDEVGCCAGVAAKL